MKTALIDRLTHFPLEIHLLILQNLDYVEFTHFSAVCKAWRLIASAARQIPFFRLQQAPWFIDARELPKLFGLHDSSCILGSSSEGWLLLTQSSSAPLNDGSSFLLNPLTRQRISLPKSPNGNILNAGVILHDQSVIKGDGIKVVAYFQYGSFYQWSSKDNYNWTHIDGHCSGGSSISDMIYHKGNIYVVKNSIYIRVFIISMSSNRPDSCLRARSPFVDYIPSAVHLVECDGHLLMVVIWTYITKVSIFKYNSIMDRWEEVKSIGEKYALLVDKGNSTTIDVSTNKRFIGNCVYFCDYDSGSQVIRCFDLPKNSIETFAP